MASDEKRFKDLNKKLAPLKQLIYICFMINEEIQLNDTEIFKKKLKSFSRRVFNLNEKIILKKKLTIKDEEFLKELLVIFDSIE